MRPSRPETSFCDFSGNSIAIDKRGDCDNSLCPKCIKKKDLSPLFVIPKALGKLRVILYLNEINRYFLS